MKTTSASPECRSTSAGSARRSSPSPELRNPTPPAPTQLANSNSPPSARGRKQRSPTRRILSTIRDRALSARIEEFERPVESIIHYAEHRGYNDIDRVQRAPRRQSPSPEARDRSPLAPTPTPEPGPSTTPSPTLANKPRTPSTTRVHRLRMPTRRLYTPKDRGKKSIHFITRL